MKNLFIILIAIFLFLGLLTPISFISKGNITSATETQDTTAVVQPLADYHNDITKYWTMIYAKEYNVPEKLMISIFYQESKFQPNDPNYDAHVVGDGGRSFGVGQVQFPTAKSVWKDTTVKVTKDSLRYNIRFNVETATRLISQLRDKYINKYKTEKEMWLAVLTTYNTGRMTRYNKYAFTVYNRYIEN